MGKKLCLQKPSPRGEGAPVRTLGRMRCRYPLLSRIVHAAREYLIRHASRASFPSRGSQCGSAKTIPHLRGKPMNLIAGNKAAAKQLVAVGRLYCTFDVSARDRGLCPHVKNRPLGGRLLFRCRANASALRDLIPIPNRNLGIFPA